MTHKVQWTPQLDGKFAFFQEFLKHPFQIGSIIPSSRYLEQRILEAADIATARTIIELGPGTGGTTRAILRAMPTQARLLSIEINPLFYAMVNRIDDARLIVHQGSAHELMPIMADYQLPPPDVIISGIPFSTMNPVMGSRILEAIAAALGPDGRFVAYQVSNRVNRLCRPYLGHAHTMIEFFNIPPMRIFQWRKQAPASVLSSDDYYKPGR